MTGCKAASPEDPLKNMTTFTTQDGSVSISLDKDWHSSETDLDFWLVVTDDLESEGCFVMQYPKYLFEGSVYDISSLKELVNDNFNLSEIESADAVEVPGMTNISVETCKMTADGDSCKAIVAYGETDYAFYAIVQVAPILTKAAVNSFKVSCSTFEEAVPEIQNSSTVALSDTLRWINGTYAILTALNQQDYNLYGGIAANETNQLMTQASLEEWWGVTDRTTADENMDWLLNEGHRASFISEMEQFEAEGITEVKPKDYADYLYEWYDVTEEEAASYATLYGYYKEFGANAIDAWDYSRAMSFLASSYIAGYYTEQEALDLAFEIAGTIQESFTSWEDYMENYLRGYEYWSGESSDERRSVYEEIKGRSDSPFSLDWNLTFEKTW